MVLLLRSSDDGLVFRAMNRGKNRADVFTDDRCSWGQAEFQIK